MVPQAAASLQRYYLRYYPPAITLEFARCVRVRSFD